MLAITAYRGFVYTSGDCSVRSAILARSFDETALKIIVVNIWYYPTTADCYKLLPTTCNIDMHMHTHVL